MPEFVSESSPESPDTLLDAVLFIACTRHSNGQTDNTCQDIYENIIRNGWFQSSSGTLISIQDVVCVLNTNASLFNVIKIMKRPELSVFELSEEGLQKSLDVNFM